MNINEAYKYIQAKARQNQVGHIPTDRLNILFRQAQMEVLDDLWGNKKEYQPGRAIATTGGYDRNQTISDELSTLTNERAYNQANITVVSDESYVEFTKPTDYLYAVDLRHKVFKNPTTPKSNDAVNKWVKVDIKTQAEISSVLDSQIVYPSNDYPVGVLYQDRIRIFPSTVNRIKLVYLRKPADPVWAYTTSGTSQIYDPTNSVDFELPETTHNEICEQVLSYIGISTRDQELYQTTTNEINRGV